MNLPLSQRLHRSFLLRLFVVACSLILLGGLSAHGMIFLSQSPALHLKEQLLSLCAEQLAPSLTDESRRAAALLRLQAQHRLTLTVQPLKANQLPAPARGEHLPQHRIVYSEGQPFLLTLYTPPPRGIHPLLLNFIGGVLAVILLTLFVAAWVAGPLRALTRAARAFGTGDLQARAHLQRSDDLGEVGRAFDDMAERIGHLLLAEKELLANISHELRTPLARIRVALDLATEGDSAAASAALGEIAVDLAELETIVTDVLTVTRFDLAQGSGGFPLHLQSLSPSTLVERACARFRAHHPQCPLLVSVSVPDALRVRGDAVLLRRVLDNLLDNAAKYSRAPTDPVELTVCCTDHGVDISVCDHGIGIAPDDLPHLFSPFFRGERGRALAIGGVGLGLTLARRIIIAHGGSIDAQSSHTGTTLHVHLAAEPAVKQSATIATTDGNTPTPG